MEKQLMSDEQQKAYNLVVHYLDVIFLDTKTINLLKNNFDFQKIIANDISIVNYFESKYDTKTNNLDRFKNSYKVITNHQIDINTNQNEYNDIVNTIDSINYTNIFVKNNLNMSIDEIHQEFNSKNRLNDDLVQQEDVIDLDDTTANSNNYGAYQSDEDIIRKSGSSIHDVADQLIASQANILLNSNIMKNKVYIYNSKPKIIPILKYLAIFLIVSMFILSTISFGMLVSQNGKLFVFDSSNNSWNKADLCNPFPFQLLTLLLVVVLVTTSLIRNNKNDNFRYKFSWLWMIFYIVICLLTTVLYSVNFVFNFDDYVNNFVSPIDNNPNFIQGINSSLTSVAQRAIDFIRYVKYIEICILCIIALLIIITVTGIIFNPKKDVKRLTNLLQQYAHEIRTGQIDISGIGGSIFNNPFGSNWF